jgi:AraC-like DNA-binding protein
VERSLEFLLSSDDSIMEVAQKSGFTDSNYYAKIFSRVKGCSPQKYRKQNTKKE